MQVLLHTMPLTLQQATAYPHLCQTLLDTQRASLSQSLVGSLPLSFLLGPGVHTVFSYVLQESVSQSCVSSCGSMVRLMVTSSKRAYAIPRSTAPRAPALQLSTADPYLHRRHSNTVLSQSLVSPRDWPRLACVCPGVSSGDMGQRWPAAGLGDWVQQCLHGTLWRGSPLSSLPPSVWYHVLMKLLSHIVQKRLWKQFQRQIFKTFVQSPYKKKFFFNRISLEVQWLRLYTSNAGDTGFISDWENASVRASPTEAWVGSGMQ